MINKSCNTLLSHFKPVGHVEIKVQEWWTLDAAGQPGVFVFRCCVRNTVLVMDYNQNNIRNRNDSNECFGDNLFHTIRIYSDMMIFVADYDFGRWQMLSFTTCCKSRVCEVYTYSIVITELELAGRIYNSTGNCSNAPMLQSSSVVDWDSSWSLWSFSMPMSSCWLFMFVHIVVKCKPILNTGLTFASNQVRLNLKNLSHAVAFLSESQVAGILWCQCVCLSRAFGGANAWEIVVMLCQP